MMLHEALASMCMLLELAAQAIEEAEAGRNRLEDFESNTSEAEQELGSGSSLSTDVRPLSWLVPVDGRGSPVSLPMGSCRLVSAHLHAF